MKNYLILLLGVVAIGCSVNDIEIEPNGSNILPEGQKEISEGLSVKISLEGKELGVILKVYNSWDSLANYNFNVNGAAFFKTDSLNNIESASGASYNFEIPDGRYLLHIGSGGMYFPGFYSLKEFTVEKGKATKLEKISQIKKWTSPDLAKPKSRKASTFHGKM